MPRIRKNIQGSLDLSRVISPWMTQFSLVDSRLIKECLSSEECYMKCMKNIAVPYKFICEAIQEEFITDIDHIPRIRGEIVGDILRGEACCGSIDENISLPELRPAFQNARTFTNNALCGEIGRSPTWKVRVIPVSLQLDAVEDLGGKRIFREQPVEDLGSSPDSSTQFSFPNWAFLSTVFFGIIFIFYVDKIAEERLLVVSGGCIIIMESLYKMDFALPVFLICSTILGLVRHAQRETKDDGGVKFCLSCGV
ncbi:hypothetical protein H6P81_006482 [Aristolochia fimbriata]|uniref:Uncharacterized protein n=1 Tax=Aristolochia fimbriata TaxID=158543 RepID=A0AAV7EXM7_ARIFI|nr:hypothetical protein H6P81_006482 [Aristolochia fimbriata]